MNKKILSILLSIFVFASLMSSGFASAQLIDDWKGGADINLDFESATEAILGAVGYFFGAFAVIMFVVCGILFLTANGDAQKLTTAKNALLWGVVGVVIGIIAFSIVGIVGGILGGGSGS